MSSWRVGIDLGATKIGLGLIDPGDQVVARSRIETRSFEGPASVVHRISECVADLKEELPTGTALSGVGICSPGPVNHIAGELIDPPNLQGLQHTPLRRMLEETLGLQVILEHDAKASALGEFHFGAGRGAGSMVYIVVGTGVGAAIIIDGQLLRGEHNTAGEVGHITIDRFGETCACGSRGCVETFVSGPWISRRYRRAASITDTDISAETVTQKAVEGDSLAVKTLKDAGEALGVAVATIAMLLNVDLFVIGSSVAKAGDLLLEPARNIVMDYCYQSVGCNVRIVQNELGDDGPILGCGWLVDQLLAGGPAVG